MELKDSTIDFTKKETEFLTERFHQKKHQTDNKKWANVKKQTFVKGFETLFFSEINISFFVQKNGLKT